MNSKLVALLHKMTQGVLRTMFLVFWVCVGQEESIVY